MTTLRVVSCGQSVSNIVMTLMLTLNFPYLRHIIDLMVKPAKPVGQAYAHTMRSQIMIRKTQPVGWAHDVRTYWISVVENWRSCYIVEIMDLWWKIVVHMNRSVKFCSNKTMKHMGFSPKCKTVLLFTKIYYRSNQPVQELDRLVHGRVIAVGHSYVKITTRLPFSILLAVFFQIDLQS